MVTPFRLACECITERTGTCPYGMHEWEREGGCETACQTTGLGEFIVECWELYFQSQGDKPPARGERMPETRESFERMARLYEARMIKDAETIAAQSQTINKLRQKLGEEK